MQKGLNFHRALHKRGATMESDLERSKSHLLVSLSSCEPFGANGETWWGEMRDC